VSVTVRLFSIGFLSAACLFVAGCGKPDAIEMIQPQATPGASAELPKYWSIPEFTLTERSGQPLHSTDLTGKVWVADFFYSSCPGPCPALTSRFSEVQKALGGTPDVKLVSISVDPAKDTTDVLKVYADRFKAGPNWFFCTGDKEAIIKLAHDGFKLPIAEGTPESGPITHTTRLILVDKTGTARGFYEGTTEEGVRDIVRDIHRLLEEK
jgi:protein SCO1/2